MPLRLTGTSSTGRTGARQRTRARVAVAGHGRHLPVLALLPGGSYSSVLASPKVRGAIQEPGTGPPGDLRLPAHALRPVGLAAFPPEHRERILAAVMADITRKNHLHPAAGTGPTRGSSNEPATTPTAGQPAPARSMISPGWVAIVL